MSSFNGYVSQDIMQHGSFIIGDVYKQKSHAFFLGIVRHFDQRQGVEGT